MKYTTWVDDVFHALERASSSGWGGVGLSAVGSEIGIDGLTYEAFTKREGMPAALMTAMTDLEAIGLVEFVNVSHGNKLTPHGRDVAAAGIRSLWPEIAAFQVSDMERAFLARLYKASLVGDERYADFAFADAEEIYLDLGLESADSYKTGMQRMTFLGDLERKTLVKREDWTIGSPDNYRPTYLAAVLIAEPDARDRAFDAGLIDWSQPTPGFEVIEERLAGLKVRLAGARSEDDLSDVGRRSRDIAVDVLDVVFRPEMVPDGVEAPSRQDAKGRLTYYLAARAGGRENEELRAFLKAALGLANARTHSSRTGHAGAVASAQGLLSFVRAIEAIERTEHS